MIIYAWPLQDALYRYWAKKTQQSIFNFEVLAMFLLLVQGHMTYTLSGNRAVCLRFGHGVATQAQTQ
jgi:hypothetical protein